MNKKIIAANWKMKLGYKDSFKLINKLKKDFNDFKKNNREIIICPSEFFLAKTSELIKKTNLKLGSQNVFNESYGAYTGEFCLKTLIELGANYSIVGHSERRQYLNETDELINKKVLACFLLKKITPIICIGENLEQKKRGEREIFLKNQLIKSLKNVKLDKKQKLIIAYEPIWAIGTGEAMQAAEAEDIHCLIKKMVKSILKDIEDKNLFVIYGGSVDSKNSKEFLKKDNIDGLLVGGASLNSKEFLNICLS